MPSEAVASATPSMRPRTAGGAPSTEVTKIGRIGYSISEAVSWKNDTTESTLMLRLSGASGPGSALKDGPDRA